MLETAISILEELKSVGHQAAIILLFYGVPYLIKRGWEEGDNDVNPRHKKSCDVCFRDIQKVNEKLRSDKARDILL